eukprot:TRINITY_DN77387_c0_g1_i1.p1 TRINITY_DN77387_c0_g1~~TRINITY_DN77387_c0_g1_i1.p1  ORF type:complete len:122 (+),score=9.36 TRINITY_DN77387_c0_g1_i1:19-384(+)
MTLMVEMLRTRCMVVACSRLLNKRSVCTGEITDLLSRLTVQQLGFVVVVLNLSGCPSRRAGRDSPRSSLKTFPFHISRPHLTGRHEFLFRYSVEFGDGFLVRPSERVSKAFGWFLTLSFSF